MKKYELKNKIMKILDYVFSTGYEKFVLTTDGKIIKYPRENDEVEEDAMLTIISENIWHDFVRYAPVGESEIYVEPYIDDKSDEIIEDMEGVY